MGRASSRKQRPQERTPPLLLKGTRLTWAIGLALLVAAVYTPVGGHQFLNFDDPQYVFENAQVRSGVTPGGVRWAFTSGHAGNWHPLTWISHMVDADVHGLDPGGHHITSVLMHAANTGLLFLLLVRLTGVAGPSALAAGLFGLHPLHVESVAWIAERKDVLSTFFWITALMAYARYVRRPSMGGYAAVAALFACGLMSKPTVVTLPLTLLLLDVWPLRRPLSARLIIEKLPLLAMSLAAGVIALVVQQQAGAVSTLDTLPAGLRVQNATIAYVAYLWKTVWPVNLAPLYPYNLSIGGAAVAGATLLLAAISALALGAWHRAPYLAVGWAWYLITLAPMIGVIQVGTQPMADRYSYVPLIGIFIAVAWGLHAVAARVAVRPPALTAAAALLLAVLAFLTVRQAALWRESVTLWTHTIEVTGPNYRARTNLGQALGLQGQWHAALPHLEEAVRIREDSGEAQYHLAHTLTALGRYDAALPRYRRAAVLSPHSADAHGSLGVALAEAGHSGEALIHLREAVRLAPSSGSARFNLAVTLNRAGARAAGDGDYRQAATHLSEAIAHDPALTEAHGNLGAVRARLGDIDGAITAYREALRLQPGNRDWQYRIDLLQAQQRARTAPRPPRR